MLQCQLLAYYRTPIERIDYFRTNFEKSYFLTKEAEAKRHEERRRLYSPAHERMGVLCNTKNAGTGYIRGKRYLEGLQTADGRRRRSSQNSTTAHIRQCQPLTYCTLTMEGQSREIGISTKADRVDTSY
jgi:hypothetical protein